MILVDKVEAATYKESWKYNYCSIVLHILHNLKIVCLLLMCSAEGKQGVAEKTGNIHTAACRYRLCLYLLELIHGCYLCLLILS